MGRARGNLITTMAAAPWPVGIAVGAAAFAAVRWGLPLLLKGGVFAGVLASVFTPLAWLLLALCWLGAAMSWLGSHRSRQLLDTRTDLDSIAALGWCQFELLVGEAFRRRDYTVEQTGLGGADGGIDLILRRNGRRTLVQCKQWRRQKVPVNVVREMYGLLAHHQADEVKIACSGGYTDDAARFAEGKPIQLISGDELLRMIRTVQAAVAPASPHVAWVERIAPTATSDACPRCGGPMVERRNRSNGQAFRGCSGFPACRGVRS